MKKTVLRSYANLIIRCGLNVQKGQEVIILAELDQPEFVKMLVEEAYKAKAEQGEELLNTMISMDEGAAYLGEVALVPQNSPIAESGLLFYNTLFDENAACHLALGHGFPDSIVDFGSKTLEECRQLGINDSMIHEDFMVGCDTMNIDAICEDGRVVPVFRSGRWAF